VTSTYSQFRETLLSVLYQEQVHEGRDDILSFPELVAEYGLEFQPGWLDELQRDLREEGLIRGPSNGQGDDMAYGKLSGAGLRYIEGKHGTLKGVPTMVSKPAYDDLLVAVEDSDIPVDTPPKIDSEQWTGGKLVLTDARVIHEVRSQAVVLRDRIYETRFESNSDSHDLKSLADALVSISQMAEPDLKILDRILSHPKFKMTAMLVAAVATIRGAAGI
tara:strand:+ start:800 stop:1456 length:657 start_codon:yes stop_codon:yes gene_type:complete